MQVKLKIKIVVEPDDGGFHAYCPDLKGLHACGETKEESLSNAVQAIQMYVASLVKHGEPIPVGVIDNGDRPSIRRAIRARFHGIFRPSGESSYVREVALPA